MLSSAPRVVGIGETYGSRDHPDEEIAAVHALVPARLHERFNRTPQCHGRDDIAAMRRKPPDWTQPPLPRW
ncbi:hypothetical protein ACWD1Y_27535 [Streptomyces sp. NPDC002814]